VRLCRGDDGDLADAYDDLVRLDRLREGFDFGGQRMSFGSFQKGIHRSSAQRGPAALTLTTSFQDPYADAFSGESFSYAYRAGAIDQVDNRALRAVYELQTPVCTSARSRRASTGSSRRRSSRRTIRRRA
jgi:hypothetical protein